MIREPLFGKSAAQLEAVASALKLPRYAARQIADWLYRKDASSFAEMTNLPLAARERLDAEFVIGIEPPAGVQVSADGTRKYLFRAGDGGFVETVYIPEQNRHTLCISSQIGCRMGCVFCMTGKQGFQGQLSVGEILNQIRSIPERRLLTNIVYMGMGEPFDNLDAVLDSVAILTSSDGFNMPPRRVTVSTVGITAGIRAYLERCRSPLAVSLHSPFEEERRRLMPVENASPLREVIDAIRSSTTHRRIFFEYIVFKGVNHYQRHVDGLARLLDGIRCRINLMRFHPVPGVPLESPDDDTLLAFRDALMAKGFIATIRRSRGADIGAACGLLSTQARRVPRMEAGLSLGTNLGDRMANLREAAARIAALPGTEITARSRIYETEPVGVKPQYRHMAYLNGVLIIRTALDATELSTRLHTIEADMGRVRTEDRFAPRPIDIDILYAGAEVRDDDDLTLPHPRWTERRFVVQPLADVRPVLIIPGTSRTVSDVLAALPGSSGDIKAVADEW